MLNEIDCKNCNGEGGWDVGIPCSPEDTMWISDGESMELGFKECFWCKGKGTLTEERILEVKKLKKSRN